MTAPANTDVTVDRAREVVTTIVKACETLGVETHSAIALARRNSEALAEQRCIAHNFPAAQRV